MDPVCHTLVGAALGEAGLKRRAGLGMATLLIGANLPDIDIVAAFLGHNLEFRRGWTHGVLALVVLPFVLTGAMLLWDRVVRRRGGRRPAAPAIPTQLLLLSSVAILTHPTLDFLNTYGMRWLMPFRDEWYYGDALFIVDPWSWLVLGVGVLLARRYAGHFRLGGGRPARWALGVFGGYALVMLIANPVGRAVVYRNLDRAEVRAERLMVAPVPVNPLRREVVVQDGPHYRFGELRWLPVPRFELGEAALERGPVEAAVRAAAADRSARAFLHWARFPFVSVDTVDGIVHVRMADARYTRQPGTGWATLRVPLDP